MSSKCSRGITHMISRIFREPLNFEVVSCWREKSNFSVRTDLNPLWIWESGSFWICANLSQDRVRDVRHLNCNRRDHFHLAKGHEDWKWSEKSFWELMRNLTKCKWWNWETRNDRMWRHFMRKISCSTAQVVLFQPVMFGMEASVTETGTSIGQKWYRAEHVIITESKSRIGKYESTSVSSSGEFSASQLLLWNIRGCWWVCCGLHLRIFS